MIRSPVTDWAIGGLYIAALLLQLLEVDDPIVGVVELLAARKQLRYVAGHFYFGHLPRALVSVQHRSTQDEQLTIAMP